MSSQHVAIIRKAIAVVRPQFRLDFNEGIHGLPHWARVWHHGRALAASLDVNPAVLAWFAFLHDSQRHNDRRDPMRLHSDGHTESEPAIIACWDADRLDLGRVRIIPDPKKLCTAYGRDPATITAAVRMSDGRRRSG